MKNSRYEVLDGLRGFAIINMILFHLIWDLEYLFGVKGFNHQLLYLWQQFICYTFILLSGFCACMGRRNLKNGAVVFLWGAVLSAVTIMIMPEHRVLFGILTLLGSCMLITGIVKPYLIKIPALLGIIIFVLLFAITKNIPNGYILNFNLPEIIYNGYFSAYLGFPEDCFFSTDYFPLIPWVFLFFSGFFLNKLFTQKEWIEFFKKGKLKFLEAIGRHSLVIYILHQPIMYGVLWMVFEIK